MKTERWHSCNVLNVGSDFRQVWQFATGNGSVSLNATLHLPPDAPLPARLVAKDWRTLWQKKLNVAWLPAEQVFLRVVHLPKCEFAEMLSMVELQLEKLSPLPVAQIVWSTEPVPAAGELQTVIVVIAQRAAVETFLGQLQSAGYLADRLELPFLHQLLVSPSEAEGASVYLQPGPTQTLAMVAWRSQGRLQNLNLLIVPNGETGAAAVVEKLTKIAWAGEVEGWLTTTPRWRLVAEPATAAIWEPALRQWTGETLELADPLNPDALAALSAQRAARSESTANLLPADFAARYRQQFVDRIWMGGLGAVMLVYLFGVLIYFGALEVLKYQRRGVEKEITGLSLSYTNALQLKARVRILQEQVNLKYAALDCWRVASELLPADLTLKSFNFARNKLTLRGIAPADQTALVTEYNTAMSKAMLNGAPLFSQVKPATIQAPPSGIASWSFECELHQAEIE